MNKKRIRNLLVIHHNPDHVKTIPYGFNQVYKRDDIVNKELFLKSIQFFTPEMYELLNISRCASCMKEYRESLKKCQS